SAFWIACTDVGGLQNCSNRSLGSNRVLSYKIRTSSDHATEILRPRPIFRSVDDHMANLLFAQFLWLRREREKSVRLSFDEQVHHPVEGSSRDPFDVLAWVHSDIGDHAGQVEIFRPASDLFNCNTLTF